jgi:hypothetical protein
MALKFVPPKEVNRYALFVDYGNGRGSLKAYNNLGSAKGAWQSAQRHTHYDSKILENVEGTWYVLYDIPKDVNRAPWYKEVERGGWRSSYKQWVPKPMTRDEYADWRVKVEHERIADLTGDLRLNDELNDELWAQAN